MSIVILKTTVWALLLPGPTVNLNHSRTTHKKYHQKRSSRLGGVWILTHRQKKYIYKDSLVCKIIILMVIMVMCNKCFVSEHVLSMEFLTI